MQTDLDIGQSIGDCHSTSEAQDAMAVIGLSYGFVGGGTVITVRGFA